MMKRSGKVVLVTALMVSVLGVSSCRTYKEGTLTQKKIAVSEERFAREIPFDGTQKAALNDIAAHYERYGEGVLHLSVLYNPASNVDTAMKATQEVAELARIVSPVTGANMLKADILPVKNLPAMKALVTFDTYAAKAPDCALLSGLEDRDHRIEMDYEMGCSVQNLIARQISNPKDLLGRDFDSAYTDARGISNQIDAHRKGEKNSSLGGESTSK